MSSCEICHDLWQFFSNPEAEKKTIDLGSFDNALASGCPDHTKIIEAFKDACISGRYPRPIEGLSDVGFRRGGPGHSTTLTESVEKLGRVWDMIAVKREEIDGHPGIGRILDPDWMDLEVVKGWKRQCLNGHGESCKNPLKIPTASPDWLIDVERKCLAPGGDGKKYVALSYRSASGALNTTNVTSLQENGALDKPEILDQIPLKIRHAISLTAELGERYLWADFLCFDSSDSTSTFDQLNRMSSIYANSLFTIIAADGDREGGINGLKGVSKPRTLNQKAFKLGNEKLIKRNTGIFALENWHEYQKRGWTYQEYKMSPRRLLFMRNEVHWQCTQCIWHEELTQGSEVDKYIDPRPQVISAGFPDLESLSHMLCTYNERDLTYDEDALAAITGLLTVFSRTFEGGFLYGLPEMMFDRALAWTPQWSHTSLRKRETSGKPSRISFSATDFPSWSWVAWQGMFSMRSGESGRVNPRMYRFEETTPITEWYTSSAPTGQPRRRIRSTWFEKREKRKDVDQPLPDGWSREPAPANDETEDAEPLLYPDDCGKYLYRHRDMPDKDCERWYFPFDVPKIDASSPCTTPEQTRYLFCTTWKVSVWSHRTLDQRFPDNHVLMLRKGPQDEDIGKLHLQTDEQMESWPAPKEDTAAPLEEGSGRTIELVAINQSVYYAKTFNETLKRYDHPLTRAERINALWLEWKDGVAYRLACGWMEKGAWESLGPEEVDLVLG